MSVYIKGIEMPTSCSTCFTTWCIGRANNPQVMAQRGEDCPLISVPDHGRLIDADATIRELAPTEDERHNGAALLLSVFLQILKDAPTIIPAEEGE